MDFNELPEPNVQTCLATDDIEIYASLYQKGRCVHQRAPCKVLHPVAAHVCMTCHGAGSDPQAYIRAHISNHCVALDSVDHIREPMSHACRNFHIDGLDSRLNVVM